MKCRVLFLACFLLSAVALPSLGQEVWCWDSDYFTTSVSDGIITVLHHNTVYNCCPDHFEYAIGQQGMLITVVETEVLGGIACPCLCCFDIPVQIGPVPPGQYRIEFSWHDYETGPRNAVLNVLVPERGQQGRIARYDVIVDPPPCQHTPPAGVEPGVPAGPDRAGAAPAPILHGSYPNPMQQSAVIEYEVRSDGPIHLDVFNAGGARVRLLADELVPAGRHRVIWDGRDDFGTEVPAGVYFCRLGSGGAHSQQRLVLVR